MFFVICMLLMCLTIGIFLLTNYGWYILLGLVVMVIVWANIKPAIQRWLKKREQRQEELNFDPVKAERYQDAMLKSREKMQKDLEEKAMEHQAVMEEVGLDTVCMCAAINVCIYLLVVSDN